MVVDYLAVDLCLNTSAPVLSLMASLAEEPTIYIPKHLGDRFVIPLNPAPLTAIRIRSPANTRLIAPLGPTAGLGSLGPFILEAVHPIRVEIREPGSILDVVLGRGAITLRPGETILFPHRVPPDEDDYRAAKCVISFKLASMRPLEVIGEEGNVLLCRLRECKLSRRIDGGVHCCISIPTLARLAPKR